MSEEQKPKKGKLNLEIPEDKADGVYANLAIISHSNAEFIADFFRVMPGVPKGKLKSRIVLTPHHAKRLMRALQDNIHRFEKNFGKIEENQPNDAPPTMNFGGPVGEA